MECLKACGEVISSCFPCRFPDERGGTCDPGAGKQSERFCVFHERTFRLYPVLPDFIDEKGAKSDEFMDFFVFSEGFFQKNREDDLTSGGSVIY